MQTLLLLLVLFPIVTAVPAYFIAKAAPRIREWLFRGIVLAECALGAVVCAAVCRTGSVALVIPAVLGQGLSFCADNFRILYTCISLFLWLMTITFSGEYMRHYEHKERYYLFYLITLGGVMGVFLSADLFTTFVFFEIMSFASYPLVIHEENPHAMRAGETYLGVAVISGMVLLVGLFMLYTQAGTLDFMLLRSFFTTNGTDGFTFAAGILILLGFGAKAGTYPLHVWLPKAHPVAPAPASALLSGILTKSGVFGIIVLCADVFAGNERFAFVLLTLAVITMFTGALLALFSTNLKRTLACSSMSQIGFILVGASFTLLLGHEGGLAQCGTLLHMANHSLIKLTLFMAAGVVAMNLHALELNDIRGFGRKKPFIMVIFLIGALGIMGIPGFCGYISKTMLHEGIVEYIAEEGLVGLTRTVFKSVEWIFLLSGGLTVAYMTKLFVCIFVEKNADAKKQAAFDAKKDYLSGLSRGVFVLSALPMLCIGLLPQVVNLSVIAKANDFFGVEVFTHKVAFFGLESLKGAAISIGIGAVVYCLFVRKVFIRDNRYVDLWPKTVDLEEKVYRPVLIRGNLFLIRRVFTPLSSFFEIVLTRGTLLFIRYVFAPVASFVETVLIKGTVLFTLYAARFIAIAFDAVILFLMRTVLHPHAYHFRVETNAERIGRLIVKISGKKTVRHYASRLQSLSDTVSDTVQSEYNSFSFAFAMISLGIIIVLLFVLLR